MKSNLIVEAVRNNIQEKRFYGWILVVDKNNNLINSLRHQNYTCFMRSCEKPIQALTAIDSGAMDKFNFNEKNIAIGFSSHSGSKEHVKCIEEIYSKLGIKDEDLLCGSHYPLDRTERHRLIKNDLQSLNLHNNCSGKHVTMIAACLAQGWDISNYTDLDHPLQKQILELIKKYCQFNKLGFGSDGCSMPVHAMPLSNMGSGLAKFFDGTTPGAEIIADAVTKYPNIAGGEGRIDTSIIQSSKGSLIAKIGAEGLIIVTPRHSGEALVVKISDGNDHIRNYVVVQALKQLGWVKKDPAYDEFLKHYAELSIYNHKKQIIGGYNYKFKL